MNFCDFYELAPAHDVAFEQRGHGGAVAFEMAAMLMCEGEEVATLALIDCAPPGTVPSRALDPRVVTLFARVIGVPVREEDVPELGHDETVRFVARRVAHETVAFGTEEEIATRHASSQAFYDEKARTKVKTPYGLEYSPHYQRTSRRRSGTSGGDAGGDPTT